MCQLTPKTQLPDLPFLYQRVGTLDQMVLVIKKKKNHQKYMAQHITNLVTIKDNLILHMFDGYMVL